MPGIAQSNAATEDAGVPGSPPPVELQEALRASEARLATELAAMTRLHALSTRLLVTQDLPTAMADVLENAMLASGADFGFIKLYDPSSQALDILAQRGFPAGLLTNYRTSHIDDDSACARAMRSGQRILIEDAEQDPAYAAHRQLAAEAGFRAVQCTPLKTHNESTLGILATHFRQPHRPSERDQRLLDLHARHAADFLLHLRSVDALRKQSERLRLLWEAAAVLLNTDNPDAMLRGLFAKIAPHLGLDVYFNFMTQEGDDALTLKSCIGVDAERQTELRRLEFGQAVCGTVALQRQERTAFHIQESADPKVSLIKSLGLRGYWCCPLLAGDRLVGTLSFGSRSRDQFEDDELDFLRTICGYVTVADERLRLVREMRLCDQQKDEFLAMLGHELRNPLAPLQNAVEILKLSGPKDQRVAMVRDLIGRQVHHLVRLVDDLLDISRIMRGKIDLRFEVLELAPMIARAIETAQPLLDSQGHQLAVTLPPSPLRLCGDRVRLAQVFANLLNNAAKYTAPGGHIELAARRVAGEVVVAVRDNGAGIAPQMLPKVFDLFVQADRTLDRSQGGLGIGLTLVQRLVALHGGRVSAASPGLGHGSEFTVYLPLRSESALAPQAAAAGLVAPQGGGLRILIVDDNVDNASSLAMLLDLLGHRVRVAADGPSALSEAQQNPPQLVLLDIGLPGMDGYEVAQRLRQQPGLAGVVVVAMTGYGQEADRRRSAQAGFHSHLIKPVEPTALQTLLSEF